jgi:hypothetical protein
MAFYNESKFNMWRACISTIWIDGEVSPEEKSWIENKINTLKFTEEQKIVLSSDFKDKTPIKDIVHNISDRKDRAFLLHQIRVISNLDNDYSETEQQLFTQWEKIVKDGLDLESALKELNIINVSFDKGHKDTFFEATIKQIDKLI